MRWEGGEERAGLDGLRMGEALKRDTWTGVFFDRCRCLITLLKSRKGGEKRREERKGESTDMSFVSG
jgi:hypothetical protein